MNECISNYNSGTSNPPFPNNHSKKKKKKKKRKREGKKKWVISCLFTSLSNNWNLHSDGSLSYSLI